MRTTAADDSVAEHCEGSVDPLDPDPRLRPDGTPGLAYADLRAFGQQLGHGDCVGQRIGWYCFNSGGVARPSKQLEPNAWGLYDVSGNLNEWASDRFDGSSPTSATNPGGTIETRDSRNIRGGAYYSWASLCRTANTSERAWYERHSSIGFRLVRTLNGAR